MRSTFAALVLSLAGCWNGADASHLPCTDDAQCGRGQSCIDRFCDGPPVDSATSSGSGSAASASTSSASGSSSGNASSSATGSTTGSEAGTETGETCDPPVPTTCDPRMRPATRSLIGRELVEPQLGRANAVVAGDFVGDARIDIAALSRDEYAVIVLENAGETWPVAGSYSTPLTELNDMLTADVDGADGVEFLLLSGEGEIEVLGWDKLIFEPQALVEIDVMDLVSFTAADLLGADSLPELVVSGSTAVYLVTNDAGFLTSGEPAVTPGTFAEPWDTLVIGEGENLRVLVPESNNASTAGDSNQDVHALSLVDDILVDGSLATNFRNPWAVAQGDFIGDDELEIVVAERRLDGMTPDVDGTTTTGQLRFFRMQDGAFEEVGEPLEVGVGPVALAAADLDCDGKTDLVLGNTGTALQDDGRAQVLFGSCEPSARAIDLLTLDEIGGSGLTSGWRLAVGDFDDDGLLEVAIPDSGDILMGKKDVGRRVVFVGVQEAE